jgi:hypothetical protein
LAFSSLDNRKAEKVPGTIKNELRGKEEVKDTLAANSDGMNKYLASYQKG